LALCLVIAAVSIGLGVLGRQATVQAASKSIYVIADLNTRPTPIMAYGIEGTSVVYQATYSAPYYSGGAVGMAMDSDNAILFIVYEFSTVIQLVDAQTMQPAGTTTISDLGRAAGVVYDHDNQRLYAVNRGTGTLYVFSWDPVSQTLTYQSTQTLAGASAFGIALDEQNDLLYVGSGSAVNYYRTSDWALAGSFTVSEPAIGIAVDTTRGYVYTAGGFSGYTTYRSLIQYDLNSGSEASVDLATLPDYVTGEAVFGVAVDDETGMIYCTTGYYGDRIRVFDTSLNETDRTSDIGNPTAIVVPGKAVSYNPIGFTKSDGLEEGECVRAGDTITYTLAYDNSENTQAVHNVTITDTLPSEVSFVSATGGGIYDSAAHAVAWDIGTIATDDPPGSAQVVVEISADVGPGSNIRNSAMIDSDETPPVTQETDTPVCTNSAPVAVDDSYATAEDTPLIVPAPGVLADDTDAESDPLTAVKDSGPTPGTLLFSADGSFTYTPTLNFNGVVTFTYHANDGTTDSNTATVTIAVTGVNDPPTISEIPDQITHSSTTVGPIAFTIRDVETPADSLTLSAGSSNTALVPVSNIVFGGAGTDRTVTITPKGTLVDETVTITITVDDGTDTASESFALTAESFRVHLPSALNNCVTAPDLVVESLAATANNVQVVIKNQGNGPAIDDFWVDVYIDPDPAPTAVNQMWPDLAAEGLTWEILADMQPGDVLTLTVGDAHYAPEWSEISWPLPVGTPIYAQVDCWNGATTYGAVLEDHEIKGEAYNNISDEVLSTATFGAADAGAPSVTNEARSAPHGRAPRRR
jgi:uncharacterized repeat protein (TIGR01451 family)